MSLNKPSFKDVIVHVDDEQDLLDTTKLMLEMNLEVPIHSFSDVHEAISFIRLNPVLVLFLDIQMPEMDGIEFAEKVRKMNPHVPIYFISANATRERAIQGMRIGVSGVIDKPFTKESILGICHKYIQERQDIYDRDLREIEELTQSFVEEAQDLFQDLDQMIIRLGAEQSDSLVIDSLFRNVHSVKGAAGAIPNAVHLAQLTHEFENVLSKIKQKALVVSDQVIDVFLAAADLCHTLLSRVAERSQPTEEEVSQVESSCQSLLGLLSGAPAVRIETKVEKVKVDKPVLADEDGIYVSMEKLDEFLNLSAEMTVLKNYFQLLVKDEAFQHTSSVVVKKIENMLLSYNKISDSLQKQIMSVRQVKMEKVCSKLPRLVRSTSQEVRKKVQLDLQGMDIGVDKNIANDLSQALTHMIRNSIDHGIESPEVRQSSGKPAEGKITLSCAEKDGVMKFVLSDDGGGLKKDLILKKAIEKSLVTDSVASKLSDEEVFSYIFHPGFSTAAQVTSVSGRGVGMDVVNSMVVTNRGKINVQSKVGEGTTITIDIPVPKSVLVEQAVLVKDLGQYFVVPLTEVISVDVIGQMTVTEVRERKYLDYRGESVPLVRYTEVVEGLRTELSDPKRMIVVAAVKNQKVALTVDSIEGQFEAVIMPFDQMTKAIPGFKGTALIGEGSIAYVLSAESLLDLVHSSDAETREMRMSA